MNALRCLATGAVLLALGARPLAAQAPATNAAAGDAPRMGCRDPAPARFTIAPDRGDPALFGRVKLYLPDPKWETLPLRVFTDTRRGRRLGPALDRAGGARDAAVRHRAAGQKLPCLPRLELAAEAPHRPARRRVDRDAGPAMAP
ncbi:MAG: hypothetical protein WDO13_07370 [Verrucomicrobiota bacterium]